MTLMTSFVFNVTFDCADPRRVAAFWAGATGYEVAEERPDFVRLRATDPRGVRHLLFFQVPEPKAGKNRVHVDLATRDPAAEVDRLVALGATKGEHRSGNGTSWTVMRDPEGNEFCIG
jgi:catechol 2,3-dioxygenase-like lactoylglutathione lyase family enzyme